MSRPTLDWPALRDYRDYMIRHLDDAKQVQGYADQGITVIKATGRITGRTSQGRLKVGPGVPAARPARHPGHRLTGDPPPTFPA